MPGYNILESDKENIDKRFLCAQCNMLIRDAVQTVCGHHICSSCVELSIVSDGSFTCPVDGETIQLHSQVYPDNFVRREILSLVVRCTNIEAGCKWRGEVRHLTNHTAECPFQKVKCGRPDCDVVMLRKDLQVHLQNDCEYRTKPCEYCGEEVQLADMKNHTAECPFQKVKCDRPDCDVVMSRKDLQDHLQNDCEYRTKPCVYCGEQVPLAVMQRHHKNKCVKYPLTCPKCGQDGISRENMPLHSNPVSGDCSGMERPCPFSGLGCPAGELITPGHLAVHKRDNTVAHLDLMMKELQRMQHVQSGILQSLVANPGTPHQIQDRDAQLREREAAFEGRVAQFQDDINRRLEQQDERTTNMADHLTLAEIAIQRMENRNLTHETCQPGINSIVIGNLEMQLRQIQSQVRNAEYIWKIDQVARRRDNAISGQQTSFYSPPFYSSREGYKMCARIYLNGDGMGRGNSISLFFVIMPGEYDALLRWPFRHKVTLMLLDQDNVEHVIEAFRPDPSRTSSSSFQRPRAKMNIAIGCPLFCPLTELPRHAYIKDDVMFIKVIVDTFDT